MSPLPSALTFRLLAVLYTIILVLALLTILFQVQVHMGTLPSLVQWSEAILHSSGFQARIL